MKNTITILVLAVAVWFLFLRKKTTGTGSKTFLGSLKSGIFPTSVVSAATSSGDSTSSDSGTTGLTPMEAKAQEIAAKTGGPTIAAKTGGPTIAFSWDIPRKSCFV